MSIDATVLQNLPIIICNADGKQVSRLTQYSSFEYTERWGARDSFTLETPRNAPHADELLVGRVLLIPADEYNPDMRALFIKQIEVGEDTITVSGNDYLWDLFGARLVLAHTKSGSGTDKQDNQPAETAARHYIVDNIITPLDAAGNADSSRGDTYIVLDAPAGTIGEKVTVEGRLQSVAEIVESICEQSGVHVNDDKSTTEVPRMGVYGVVVEDSTARGWHILVRFRLGIDRSQTSTVPDNNWVVLSEAYHNIIVGGYSNTLPDGNVVIVAGEGSASSRQMVVVGDKTLTGVSRRESFCTASDCKTTESLEARGREVIEQGKNLTISASLTNPHLYGTSFRAGDIVSVDLNKYGAYNVRVSEATVSYTADGVRVEITLGDSQKGIVQTIRAAIEGEPLRRQ